MLGTPETTPSIGSDGLAGFPFHFPQWIILPLALVFLGPGIHAQNPQKRDVAYIEIGSRGFIPQHLTHPAGKIIMNVRNFTDYKINLILEKQGGSTLKNLTLYETTVRWREVVEYAPGEYVLRDANHPGWVCRISITP